MRKTMNSVQNKLQDAASAFAQWKDSFEMKSAARIEALLEQLLTIFAHIKL